MKIVVISDSHRNFTVLHQLMELQKDSADLVLFLGDGERELDDIRSLYPNLTIIGVAGNCDWGSLEPASRIVRAGKTKLFVTHGHTYGVKFSLEELKKAARAAGCRVVLYGHTHIPHTEYDDGLYVMNPGSIGAPREGGATYGVLEIAQNGILMNIAPIERQ